MPYVDGYVLAVPRKNIAAYTRLAEKASKIWKEHGALDYCESVGDDLDVGMGVPFPKIVKPKKDETIVFSYVVYKSRAHRDRVNAKVWADPRLSAMCDPKNMPFDCKRMAFGGFKVLVKA
jgi:uncharacterized protein YbaA (DUF1428 family)